MPKSKEMNRFVSWTIYVVTALLLVLGGSCTSSDEKAEQAAANAEAAQMEGKLPDPAVAARTEARKFLTRTWKDSLQLHSQLLEVKAMQSRYVMEGNKEQAAIFDSVFISTLHTVNPALAKEIDAIKK